MAWHNTLSYILLCGHLAIVSLSMAVSAGTCDFPAGTPLPAILTLNSSCGAVSITSQSITGVTTIEVDSNTAVTISGISISSASLSFRPLFGIANNVSLRFRGVTVHGCQATLQIGGTWANASMIQLDDMIEDTPMQQSCLSSSGDFLMLDNFGLDFSSRFAVSRMSCRRQGTWAVGVKVFCVRSLTVGIQVHGASFISVADSSLGAPNDFGTLHVVGHSSVVFSNISIRFGSAHSATPWNMAFDVRDVSRVMIVYVVVDSPNIGLNCRSALFADYSHLIIESSSFTTTSRGDGLYIDQSSFTNHSGLRYVRNLVNISQGDPESFGLHTTNISLHDHSTVEMNDSWIRNGNFGAGTIDGTSILATDGSMWVVSNCTLIAEYDTITNGAFTFYRATFLGGSSLVLQSTNFTTKSLGISLLRLTIQGMSSLVVTNMIASSYVGFFAIENLQIDDRSTFVLSDVKANGGISVNGTMTVSKGSQFLLYRTALAVVPRQVTSGSFSFMLAQPGLFFVPHVSGKSTVIISMCNFSGGSAEVSIEFSDGSIMSGSSWLEISNTRMDKSFVISGALTIANRSWLVMRRNHFVATVRSASFALPHTSAPMAADYACIRNGPVTIMSPQRFPDVPFSWNLTVMQQSFFLLEDNVCAADAVPSPQPAAMWTVPIVSDEGRSVGYSKNNFCVGGPAASTCQQGLEALLRTYFFVIDPNEGRSDSYCNTTSCAVTSRYLLSQSFSAGPGGTGQTTVQYSKGCDWQCSCIVRPTVPSDVDFREFHGSLMDTVVRNVTCQHQVPTATLTVSPTWSRTKNCIDVSEDDVAKLFASALSDVTMFTIFQKAVVISVSRADNSAMFDTLSGVHSSWGAIVLSAGVNNVSEIRFRAPRRLRSFDFEVSVTFVVTFTKFFGGSNCTHSLAVNQTIRSAPLPTPQSVRSGVRGFIGVSTSVGSLVSVSNSPIYAQMSLLTLSFSACQFSDFDSPSLLDSPTQLAVGSGDDDPYQYNRGTVIGNVLILWTCVAAVRLAKALIGAVRDKAKEEGGLTSRWMATATCKEKLPGALITIYSLLAQPIISASVGLFIPPVDETPVVPRGYDYVVAIFGLAAACAPLAWWCYECFWRFQCEAVPTRKCVRRAFSSLSNLFLPDIEWRASDSVPSPWKHSEGWKEDKGGHFLRAYGPIFEAYTHKRQWFSVVELVVPLLCGIVGAMQPQSTTGCDIAQGAVLVVSALLLIAGGVLKPFSIPADFVSFLVCNGLSLLASLCVVAGALTAADCIAMAQSIFSLLWWIIGAIVSAVLKERLRAQAKAIAPRIDKKRSSLSESGTTPPITLSLKDISTLSRGSSGSSELKHTVAEDGPEAALARLVLMCCEGRPVPK